VNTSDNHTTDIGPKLTSPTIVSVCQFKRERFSEPEWGIAIGKQFNDIWVIVDAQHNVLNSPPYNYICHATLGAFTIQL